MRALTRAAARGAVALLGLGACGRGGAPAPATPADAPRLAGVWTATFTLDAPPVGFDSEALRRAPGGRVQGTLAVVTNRWLTAASGASGNLPTPPTLYGTYDVDFAAFGFDPRDPERIPDVVGTASPSAAGPDRDSVRVVLGPTSERGQVVLAGTRRADSVVGTWQLESPGRGGQTAGGHFVLVASAAAPPRPAARAALGAGLGARARAALHPGGRLASGTAR